MKLILKTITGKQHEVEVEPTATILDVKRLVEDEYEPASLRLCYNGAVLEDSKTVVDAGVKEGESLVLAGRKRKIPKPPAPPPADAHKAELPTSSSTEATTPASAAPVVANNGSAPSSLPEATTPSDATAAAANAPAPTPSFLAAAAPASTSSMPEAAAPAAPPAVNTFGAPTNLIDEVCSMGFEDRHQVALALRAAYMNVDRAVEYLVDGIPPHLVHELTRDTTPAAPSPATTSTRGAPTSAEASAAPAPTTASSGTTAPVPSGPESELRAALAGIPQFDQIRALYLQNTETLPIVTQQIALRHPAVYELIERNPEAFLAIMSETGSPGMTERSPPQSGTTAASTAYGTARLDEEGGFMNQLPAELELTDADRVAVQQLVELGGGMWDEQSALLVYLATQRNQEVAASILFEHGGVPPELLTEIANQMAEQDEDEDEEGNEGEQQ
ncbi:Uv excision repair RAD23-like protein [Leptomonas pyrrhocoris]|uniref:UV excision repair protein RAD23 n=1 Tax=Leptomonas pyrrhocoris TaxID=157538 RepID=A0A0M9G6J4_LEPPY|nr:Uv excision repair RAD23-like protein [Leptomonas pyrrhocoris]KPA83457.1 Uv excision repair RAD23-like protein [Leptomonas pyrrhocoris]|eukprot:XP_015661896.1 Uv excision repair RAD23-like protein [Leptomonas pyrrhocoris]